MKVLFLDVDGVLNHVACWGPGTRERFSTDVLDPECIRHLKGVVLGPDLEPRARVVLSSTWRLMDDARRLIDVVLWTHGIDLLGVTPENADDWEDWSRGYEIAAWLKAHPEVTHYAIVDDGADAGEGHPPERFVQTDMRAGGLTAALAARLREALEAP